MALLSVLDPALNVAYALLTTLADALHPLTGPASTVLALVLLTLLVRACLLPLAISVLRSDRAKRALAPELARIRRRHSGDSARRNSELLAAHQRAGIRPLAGLLPALAQAPAVLVVYRLCQTPVVAGGPNTVLSAQFLGAPLGGHLPATVMSAGLLTLPTLAVVLVVGALLVLAHLTSGQQVARLRLGPGGEPVAPAQVWAARWLPYGTVAMVAVVPLAVVLYLVTSNAWLVAERALLPRLS